MASPRGEGFSLAFHSKKAIDLSINGFWSEWRESNSRPLEPHSSALPNCATPGCHSKRQVLLYHPFLKCQHVSPDFLNFFRTVQMSRFAHSAARSAPLFPKSHLKSGLSKKPLFRSRPPNASPRRPALIFSTKPDKKAPQPRLGRFALADSECLTGQHGCSAGR